MGEKEEVLVRGERERGGWYEMKRRKWKKEEKMDVLRLGMKEGVGGKEG